MSWSSRPGLSAKALQLVFQVEHFFEEHQGLAGQLSRDIDEITAHVRLPTGVGVRLGHRSCAASKSSASR